MPTENSMVSMSWFGVFSREQLQYINSYNGEIQIVEFFQTPCSSEIVIEIQGSPARLAHFIITFLGESYHRETPEETVRYCEVLYNGSP